MGHFKSLSMHTILFPFPHFFLPDKHFYYLSGKISLKFIIVSNFPHNLIGISKIFQLLKVTGSLG